MRKRSKMSRKKSKKNFRSGNRVKYKNLSTGAMRGGIRL